MPIYLQSSSGGILLTSGGKIAASSACCCSSSLNDCGDTNPVGCSDITPPDTLSAFITYTASADVGPCFPCNLARNQTAVLTNTGSTTVSGVIDGSGCTSNGVTPICSRQWSGGFSESGCTDATFGLPLTSEYTASVWVTQDVSGDYRLAGRLLIHYVDFSSNQTMEIYLLSDSLGPGTPTCTSFSSVTLTEVCRQWGGVGNICTDIGTVTFAVSA